MRDPESTRPQSSSGAATPPAPHFSIDADVHLLDRLAVIYRYRYVAITVFVLSAAAMMIQGYTTVQMFEAQARLLIENERSTTLPGLTTAAGEFYEDPEPYYETQYKILRGRDLARRVVHTLKLDTVPEFNGTAVQPAPLCDTPHKLKDRALSVFTPPATLEPPKPDESADESALVSTFISRVNVSPVRGSRLVDVSFTSQT